MFEKFRSTVRRYFRYASIVLYMIIIFTAVLITIPSESGFLSQIKFNPTLDFYGGSKVSFIVTQPQISEAAVQDKAKYLERLMQGVGIADHELRILAPVSTSSNEVSQYEIEVSLSRKPEDIEAFLQILQLPSDLQFSQQAQNPEATDDQLGQSAPQFTPAIGVTFEDVETVTKVYGAETGGYGLMINFNENAWNRLLFTTVSDISGSGVGQLYITTAGQPLAAQRFAISSQASSRQMTFSTFLGNDNLAASTLNHIASNGGVTPGFVVNTDQISVLPGRYDNLTEAIKITAVALVILMSAGLVIKYKVYSFARFITFIGSAILPITVSKLLNLPIDMQTVITYFAMLFIIYLPLIYFKARRIVNLRTQFRNFVIAVTISLTIASFANLPEIGSVIVMIFLVLSLNWIITSTIFYNSFKLGLIEEND